MVKLTLPDSGSIRLGDAETRELVDILWGVSAMPGAVVAIGRLNHSLVQPSQAVQLTEREAAAVRAGLEAAERLPDGLSQVLSALVA